MQTLWSRVAQTRGACSCPQCVPIAQGLSRRATASATRRTPKFLTSSTFFYSGIFAAAATWDAGAKKQRREQWDRAIAEVQDELGQAAEQASHGLSEEKANAPAQVIDGNTWLSQVQSDVFADVEPHKRKPLWPTNTGPDLKVYRLPPQSIYASGEIKARSELRRWTAKKLETVMLSIDLLQLEIFCEIQKERNREWREEVASAVPVSYQDNFRTSGNALHYALHNKSADLKAMQNEDVTLATWSRSPNDLRLTNYQQDDQGRFHDTTAQLNGSLQDLFKLHAANAISVPSLLAKLAYNLHISTAPPNIHTYNTLLMGLSDAQQPRLVAKTISSLRATKMRPNEVTNRTILEHFTRTDDVAGFVHWVELMRGKHSGLALAANHIRINKAGASRLVRIERQDRGLPDKIIQLPYPTPDVFGAMIKGVVKFSGFEAALGICEGMGREGWGLCMAGLTPLLVECANRADWTSGLAVWRQIQALKLKSLKRWKEYHTEQIGLDAFAAMVRLCSACGQKGVFDEIWVQAMSTHRQATQALSGLVKAQSEALRKSKIDQAKLSAAPQQNGANQDAAQNVELAVKGWREADLAHSSSPDTTGDSSTVLREPRNEAKDLRQVDTVQDDIPAEHCEKHRKLYTAVSPRQNNPSVLLREQLDGLLPPSHELDDYEMRERPMNI